MIYRNLFSSLIILAIVLSSCSDKVESNYEDININLEQLSRKEIIASDYISEIQLIPLASEKKCMLNAVDKLIVTDKGFLIMDYSSASKVFLFEKNGDFHCQIGDLGHSEREYSYLFDFSTDQSCDTIVLSTIEGIMFFNSEGELAFTHSEEEPNCIKQIAKGKIGYVCSTNHFGGKYLLELYDNDFKFKDGFLSTDEPLIKMPPLIGNFLRIKDDKIIFYDYFDSSLYIVDTKGIDNVKRIRFISNNMLTIDKALEEKNIDQNFDCIYNFIMVDNTVRGNIKYKNSIELFEIDLDNNTCILGQQKDWIPEIMDYKDEYYYSILSQDLFMDIIDGKFYKSSYIASLIKEEYASQKWRISENGNYIILKMKRKEVKK